MQDELLKKALGYPRFSGNRRILILDTGYLVVRDIVDGAAELGWETLKLATKEKGRAEGTFVNDLLKALVTHRPDFVVTVNHLGFDAQGVLAGLLNKYEIPLASWFVDHPTPILGGAPANATQFTQVFCFERTAIPWLQGIGFEEPQFLPTGSNQRYFHPDKVDTARAESLAWPLTFAGNSWWGKAVIEPLPKIKKAANKLRRKTQVNREGVANGMLEKLDGIDLKVKNQRGRYAAAQVALAHSSMETRGKFATALKPAGIRIHGDKYWKKISPGVNLVPFEDYEIGLPALFSGCAVNANVTAEQMPTAVNQRVWDVPGAGGFILTDAQEDALDAFAEDVEIVVYRDFEEAAQKARYYIEHPEKAQQIARRAFEKVEKMHRVTHRLEKMSSVMQARFA